VLQTDRHTHTHTEIHGNSIYCASIAFCSKNTMCTDKGSFSVRGREGTCTHTETEIFGIYLLHYLVKYFEPCWLMVENYPFFMPQCNYCSFFSFCFMFVLGLPCTFCRPKLMLFECPSMFWDCLLNKGIRPVEICTTFPQTFCFRTVVKENWGHWLTQDQLEMAVKMQMIRRR